MPKTCMHTFRILTFSILALGLLFGCAGEKRPEQAKKLIILGFDGVDPEMMNRWMEEGKLPNLRKLKNLGGYSDLISTIPPHSPVAWSSFATGTNPGGHGIYDFVHRTPDNYLPKVATMNLKAPKLFLGLFPTSKAEGLPTRGGVAFWKLVAEAGLRATLLSIPYTFPPEDVGSGKMLGGLGVPDLRETNSSFTYLATDLSPDELAQPVGGGKLQKVTPVNGEIATQLDAMLHPTKDERIQVPINFTIKPDQTVEIRLSDNTVLLNPNSWSEWLPFSLKITPFFKVTGICRFYLFSSAPEFRLYVSPLCFDPETPFMPITYPTGFAKELFDKVGYFKTVGWVYDTSALNAERLTDALFIEDMKTITAEQERIFTAELEKKDWDLFIGVFTDTDRSAHMFYRYLDTQHPLYDPVAANQYGSIVEWTYTHMDKFVGDVMDKYLDANTTLLIVSDHGFHSFRRGFNTNTWLAQNGYLVFQGMDKLLPGQQIPEELYPTGDFFPKVNWSKTKAYALGTGQIYVNLKGREGRGIVTPGAEYDKLLDDISAGLLAVRDPQNGAPALRSVYKGKEVFKGDYTADAPDLQLAFHDGYRTSEQTMLGGIPKDLFTTNMNKWSGDHAASDVVETSGVLFSSQKITKSKPAIIDIAPTVLQYFDLEELEVMEGAPIF